MAKQTKRPKRSVTTPMSAGRKSTPPHRKEATVTKRASLPSAVETDWERKKARTIKAAAEGSAERRAYAHANAAAIAAAISGRGPDSMVNDPDNAAHAVVNISSAHIPSFVSLSKAGDTKPYKNGYDLGKYRVGESPPDGRLKTRELVDQALPLNGNEPKDVYFCAVELSGTGMRLYGDVTLVVANTADETVILDRNSYDLMRSPLSDIILRARGERRLEARKKEAAKIAGRWKRDLQSIAVIKVLERHWNGRRRLTPGMIAEAILEDEDYIEVLRIGSFSVYDLCEARTPHTDAAREALIAERARLGPPPTYASNLWRRRRRRAERALSACNVRTIIATGMGRSSK